MATKRSTPADPAPAPERLMVGVAHDEYLVRKGFRSALQEAGMEVAVAVETLAELEVGLRTVPGVRVLVVQLRLPLKEITDDLERLMRRSKLPVIMIGALNGPVVEALVQLDVKGLLTNKVLDTELVQAVQVVAQGGIHANNWMLDQLKHKRKRSTVAEQRSSVKLSALQEQTAQLLFDHPELSIPALAVLAKVNERTLESRAKTLFEKLCLANRHAFMKYKGLYG
jgi:DNA-binding NarL/FixJ family response regulator